ncbi:rhamnogalacturonan lyase [Chitinophaga horti]|uniref:Rhamnogalacturonan lyase n=1 Tax=Chitinophaga horti TaxID=2920382 RepID=A0ABY6J3S8_9BACT|nr:rhamnogalacturonan lyase [Chitinophaga horti]UYQ94036.1 rhamnogalacturonan lyase [Chitinophaga horti]
MKKLLIIPALLACMAPASAQRQMEKLDRGLIAVPADKGYFVSWRLFGTDDPGIGFDVYRSMESSNAFKKLNKSPITNVTSLLDTTAVPGELYTYQLRQRGTAEGTFRTKKERYLSIPLQTPAGYAPNDGSVGDLDGDGKYEIVLHQTGRAKDNSQAGITDPPIFQAYTLEGKLLWTINLGKNIRDGAHYTQFMVYDLDGDGRAEIAMKTADGTIDGKGKVVGDSTKDYRNEKGYILAGPEYLTIFDGLTGAALATTDYIPARHPSSLNPTTEELKSIWGDGYGNRMDRFLACVAYLDGKRPSLVMTRGYYTRSVLSAWNWRDGKLTQVWTFDSDDASGKNRAYRGQGNHNLTVADVDNDGKDEIIFGAMTLDDNGTGLYSTGLGHGDALHVTDLDPSHPGLEVFDIQERFDDAGCSFRDARTGEILWKKPSIKAGDDGEGPGRGLALDIDPRYPGYECWVAGAGITGMFDAKGNKIADRTPACNMGIYWDGDVLSEILNGTDVQKWDYINSKTVSLLDAAKFNCVKNNGTKSNPVLSADILGDWREEVIYRTTDNNELRIFSTNIPTDRKFYTLMHDPQYRLSIAWQNVAYNQPPHTGFHMGEGMPAPPKPNIQLINTKKKK